MENNTKFVGKKEFWMYAVGGMGQGMIYAIMSSYISEFYLNVAVLPPLFVLLLMLLARVWDAVNDPMMGMIADRYTTKWGKYKPYVLFTPIPVAILTFLMFYVPEGFSQTQMMIYAAVTYTLWGMIYTVSDVPFWSLPNAMTPDAKERANVISFSRTLNGVGSAVPMAIYFVLSWVLGKIMTGKTDLEIDKAKYMIIALICAVIGSAIFLSSYFFVKERVIIPNKPRKDKSEPSVLSRIFSCKPLMLVVVMGVLASGRYLVQAAAAHVARYTFYIGPDQAGLTPEQLVEALQSSRGTVSTVFMVCAAIGMFGAMLFMPLLYKKFNYKKIVITSCLAGAVASVIMTLVGWFAGFWACIPFIIIMSIPLGVLNTTSYAMIGDCLDYMEWKTGYRETALGSACQSFVNKLGNAVATCAIVLVYLGFKIDPGSIMMAEGSINPLTVSENIRFGMFSLVSLMPGISLILCIIPVLFYDLTGEKKDKIMRELAERRASAGMNIEE
ncbi:MAG TPA: MFS transporter [Candidatus Faecicola pullistercoris]|nr:MFS transporter [Candidatus Faecicola pullistercoris]